MKQHLSYFDLLRLAASFFVVLMHTASESLQYQVAQRTGWFLLAGTSSLTFCAVPLFFMMSGYLLTSSSRTKDVDVLLKERLPRLIVPLGFWSVLYILWEAFIRTDWSAGFLLEQAVHAVQSPANVSLWFMYTMIGMYLISPVLCTGLRGLDRKGDRLVLGLILLLELRSVLRILFPDFSAEYLNWSVLNSIDFFGSYLCCFVLGWYLGRMERRLPQPVLLLTGLVTWGLITIGTIISTLRQGAYISSFQTQSAGFEVLLAACLFLMAKQLDLSRVPRIQGLLHALAPATFAVYLMHNLLLKIIYWVCSLFSFGFFSFSSVMAVGVGLYLVSLVIAWVFTRIPGLSYLACGTRRR